MQKIAVLITSHNRKDTTLKCLKSLYLNQLPIDFDLDLYLVDDGSTDGTAEAVNELYPQVCLVKGDGNLFWNQGMRLAWNTAIAHSTYDFYLWLNDDTIIDPDALSNILETSSAARFVEGNEVIVTGACRNKPDEGFFSYGGRSENGPVIPNGQLQKCKYINGNFVLVPLAIYKKIGPLSENYTHALGDIDYGLQALKHGFDCYTTKKYIASCSLNYGTQVWCNSNFSLSKRWKSFNSIKGLNIKEYILFRKKHWPNTYWVYALKAYLKFLFPGFYKFMVNALR